MINLFAYSQTPQAFNYQAIIRDNSGNILANRSVSIQLSIIDGVPDGPTKYSENHSVTTNQFGLVNLQVGKGIIQSGSFETIEWGTNDFYLQVAIDQSGDTNFIILGTSQLLSVPYALYAENVKNKDDADADSTNEIQKIWLSNDTIFLSDGGFIKLPHSGSQGLPLIINLTKTDVTCPGGYDGSIIAEISGGTAPFTIEWSNGSNSNEITNLGAGKYDIFVRDSYGHTAVNSITILDTLDQINISIIKVTHESTALSSDGSIDIEVTGGTPPYNYQWSNGDNTEDLLNVSYGQYTVSITDANQCTSSNVVKILLLGNITDYEGNVYETVQVGDQFWMRENIRSTKFSDGVDIESLDTVYPFDTLGYESAFINTANVETEGRLYQSYYAFRTKYGTWETTQGVCPAGWHIPSEDDWDLLDETLTAINLDIQELLNINYPGYVFRNEPTIQEYGDRLLILSSGRGQAWATDFKKNVFGYSRKYDFDNIGTYSYMIRWGYYSVRCIKD